MEYFCCTLTIWLLSATIAGSIGGRKGEGGKAFLVGLLLGPLGVLLAMVSSGDRRPCPHCAEPVRSIAKVCPHCRNAIGGAK